MTTVQQAISSVGPVLLLAANCTTSPGSTSSPPEPDASLDASATEIINLQPTADCRHPDVERNCNDGFCRIPGLLHHGSASRRVHGRPDTRTCRFRLP